MVLVVLPPVVVEEIVRGIALLAGKLCQVALLSLGLSSVTAQLEVPLVGLVFIVGIEYVVALLLLLLPALVPVLSMSVTKLVSSVASCIVRV